MAKRVEAKKPVTILKDLPRLDNGNLANRFWANGIEYTIRTPSDVLSPTRYTEFNRLCMQAGMGLDFNQLLSHLKELERKVYEIDPKDQTTKTGVILQLNAITKAVLDKSADRYDLMLHLCCIFIVEAGEDLRQFSFEKSIEKISNWNTEGYRVNDFFQLAMSSIPQFRAVYQEAERVQASLDISL
jgi:hypothetical protein